MGYDLRIIFIGIVVCAAIFILYYLFKKKSNKSVGSSAEGGISAETASTPKTGCITVSYRKSGALLEDGKCGWLDIESESGEATYKLNFDHKSPSPMVIPLAKGDYKLTYRTKSKAAMLAEGAMAAVNESSGSLGAAANAVYKAGGMQGQFSSIDVTVDSDFALLLECTTDGIEKSCEIIG